MRVVTLCYIGILFQVVSRIWFLCPALYRTGNNVLAWVDSIQLCSGQLYSIGGQLIVYSYIVFSSDVVPSTFQASRRYFRRCSALIPEGPMERLLIIFHTFHSILSSLCTKSSTSKVSTEIGVFSPGGGMWGYSATRSTVTRSRVAQAGSDALPAADLYQLYYGAMLPCGGGV